MTQRTLAGVVLAVLVAGGLVLVTPRLIAQGAGTMVPTAAFRLLTCDGYCLLTNSISR